SLPLILLKTKSSPTDPYDLYFSAHPLTSDCPTNPIFVPVLQHHHTNLSQLRDILVTQGIDGRAESTADYTGLIITSQRSVEALGGVLSSLKTSDLTSFLLHTPIFVVGPATASAVAGLGFHPGNILGGDCGSGAILAPFILAQLPTLFPARKPKFLFLVGETRRDVIQNSLKDAEVAVTELVVYETTVMDTFRDDLVRVLEETEEVDGKVGTGDRKGRGERWVVVFSPQGADVAVEALKDKDIWGRTLVAAIGPTTEERLAGLGRRPDAVARKPSPEGLWAVVKEEVDRRNA
ncbi:tetrapyrrole biosynthesis, uroporphyrinogen III synthase, partial [Ascodesmis nigricans]